MTKEDYMRLPKERLAELLALRDLITPQPIQYTFVYKDGVPCYAPGGTCINPQMDCVNCPRHGGNFTITTNTGGLKND